MMEQETKPKKPDAKSKKPEEPEKLEPTWEFNLDKLVSRLKALDARTWKPVFVKSVDSTMNLPYDTSRAGGTAGESYVFIAEEQTKASGVRGSWFTGPNDVALTLILRDERDPQIRPYLDMAVGLAVIQTINSLQLPTQWKAFIKWPNDVYIGPSKPATDEAGQLNPREYRKIAGILTIGRLDPELSATLTSEKGFRLLHDFLLVGVGINLGNQIETHKDHKQMRGNPVSLETVLGKLIRREEVIARFLSNFQNLLTDIYFANSTFANITAFVNEFQKHLLTGPKGEIFCEIRKEFTSANAELSPYKLELQEITPGHIILNTGMNPLLFELRKVRSMYPPGFRDI